jgi:curved DNA-binding protein CbpA
MAVRTAASTDYYAILEVDPASSIQEIKRSFRKKVKEQHPDLRNASIESQKNIRILIQAYKTLSNPQSRSDYDRTHWFFRRSGVDFDYRDFLKSRTDDLDSQAKLIFFDLLHEREEEALQLYDRLVSASFDLADHLDREDFMDCAYLLSEEYEKVGDFAKAFELLRRIAEHEFDKPYFKHFFSEVEHRLQSLVCFKMQGTAAPHVHLDCLSRLADLDFPKKFTAQLYKKSAEIYLDLNNREVASRFLEKGLQLDNKLKGASKLRERLVQVEQAVRVSG